MEKKYIYEVVNLKFSIWTGKAERDYLDILNDYGMRGWKFVTFAPKLANPKGSKGIEMVFVKEEE